MSRGSVPETTVSINDDDDPAVTVSFGSATYNVTEGGTETVTVTLGAEPERTVIITLIPANQGGASDSDYSGVPASVTFGPTETSKTFTFTADDDAEDDDGERVILSFGAPLPDGVSEGTPNQSIVSITDNDAPDVDVQFGASAYTVAEGGTQTVTVTLGAEPERTVIIHADPACRTASSLPGRDREEHHLLRHSGHGRRRWGEREADLRVEPPHRCNQGSSTTILR